VRAGHRIIFKLRPWSSHGYLPPSAASFSSEPCFSVSRSPAVRISLCSVVRVAVPCACATPCALRLSPPQLRLWSLSMSTRNLKSRVKMEPTTWCSPSARQEAQARIYQHSYEYWVAFNDGEPIYNFCQFI
jgi:hypothetical protein